MADGVVSFLLENLSQLLASEAKLLGGVENRVRSLHGELKLINAFLRTSEGKNCNKEIEQEVVSQIRDVAHEAEDVIDKFIANVAIHQRRNRLGRMLHGLHHAKQRHDAANKIDNIKTIINEIRDNKVKYDFFQESDEFTTREDEERTQLLHKLRRNVEEDHVVGFVHDSKVIIKRLVEGGTRRNIVSIIGMGGLGKTTLARKVYNSKEVKQFFNCSAWVYVSNDCRARELLLGLVKCLMPNAEDKCRSNNKKEKKHRGIEKPRELSSLSVDELKKMVQDHLNRKRYLVVLDDLWKTQDWDEIQGAFPDDNRGSRILITSRVKEVCLHASQDPPYYLQLLGEEESWELFSKKVFRGEECPSDLKPVGQQIAKSCRGLPLSIVVLAGLLANKEKSHREWSKVVGHVNWYLTQDETQVKDIVLKLSYDNLPRRLKPCFLYFGIFPEDFEIPVRQLLHRWVAEGFIQQTGTRYPEDVAEDYMYELIDRSLIQVARVKTSGGVKTCRIHDLLRDLCISESKDDKFLEVCTDNDILIPTKPRRLSIHCSTLHYISSSNNDHSCVRSLLCFDSSKHFNTPGEWKWLLKGFKLVRVLDFGSNSIRNIPSNLGVLIHLRYLNLRIDWKSMGANIPTSICTLRNLQTLDMGPCGKVLCLFPSEMWKLKQLRHIYTPGPIMLYGNHGGSDDEVMWNLQTISSLALDRQTASLIQKGRFPNLRKLSLAVYSNRECKLSHLLQCLRQLTHLKALEIFLITAYSAHTQIDQIETQFGCKPQELLQSLQPLSDLNALKIYNAMDLLTCPDPFPPCITKLTLTDISRVNDDGIHSLGNLSELRVLRLIGYGAIESSFELNCVAGSSFPQLQVFHMIELNVHSWKLANGVMPCLQSLVIHDCRGLDDLPSELWCLTALREVRVVWPSEPMALVLGKLEMRGRCELKIVEKSSPFGNVVKKTLLTTAYDYKGASQHVKKLRY